MVPERISELEDIVLHHDCESFGEDIGGDIGEVVFALVDEAADLGEGGGVCMLVYMLVASEMKRRAPGGRSRGRRISTRAQLLRR